MNYSKQEKFRITPKPTPQKPSGQQHSTSNSSHRAKGKSILDEAKKILKIQPNILI